MATPPDARLLRAEHAAHPRRGAVHHRACQHSAPALVTEGTTTDSATRNQVARGKGVLVHCNAGRGRRYFVSSHLLACANPLVLLRSLYRWVRATGALIAAWCARPQRRYCPGVHVGPASSRPSHARRGLRGGMSATVRPLVAAPADALSGGQLAARREIAEMRSLCGTRPQWRAVGAFERELQVHAHEWAAAEQAAANLALALRQQVSWPSPLPLPAHGVSHGVQDAALRASVQVQRTSFTAQDQDGVYPTGGSTAWVDAGAGGAGADSGCGADGMGREGDANHEELRAPAEFSASDLLGTTGVGGDTAAVASEGESDPALPGQTSSLQRPATSQQT